MLDKFLTGENVKVNGEIAGRWHILRTLHACYKLIFFLNYLYLILIFIVFILKADESGEYPDCIVSRVVKCRKCYE